MRQGRALIRPVVKARDERGTVPRMAGFGQAVADTQTFMRDHADEQDGMDHVLSPNRLHEAEQVAPCATR